MYQITFGINHYNIYQSCTTIHQNRRYKENLPLNVTLEPLQISLNFYNSHLDAEVAFPHSAELPGRFLGLAINNGNVLTYRGLSLDNTILSRSVMRSALDNININQMALSISNGGRSSIIFVIKIKSHMRIREEYLKIKTYI